MGKNVVYGIGGWKPEEPGENIIEVIEFEDEPEEIVE